MGAGTNVQDRIIALHHLDTPYRPADLTQRNGRGVKAKEIETNQCIYLLMLQKEPLMLTYFKC